ncbi:MAG: ribonuclease domain-containing protein [Nocardioides sp.]
MVRRDAVRRDSTLALRAAMAALAALLLVVGWYWWTHTGPPAAVMEEGPGSGISVNRPKAEQTDPVSGLILVDRSTLPPEAIDTLALIKAGGPFPYDEDDGTFKNLEGLLPDRDRGYYREYTVETPGSSTRGARRIVVGGGGEYYWTEDHYQSFERIENP